MQASASRLASQPMVLLLSRFQELSFAEISGILECSVGAAKVRAHRALRALREMFFEVAGAE